MERLPHLDLFSNIEPETAREIIAAAAAKAGLQGDRVPMRPVDYFVLLDGEAMLTRLDNDRMTVKMRSSAIAPPDWLYAVPLGHEIKLVTDSRFVILDGNRIDAALDRNQESGLASALALPNVIDETRANSLPPLSSVASSKSPQSGQPAASPPVQDSAPPSEMKRLTNWLARSDVFASMSLYELVECAAALQPFEAGENWDVVRTGSEGNFFYIIETGAAEVWRAGPLNEDEPKLVAILGPGDSFGEEALLQNADRNATVRMTEAGRLWRLEKSKFDELVRDNLLKEIDPVEAMQQVQNGRAQLVDCRYDIEYEMARIPDSILIPLDELRARIDELDKSQSYLVYCRSGQRSRAAAFLMQRMGLKTRSVRGGITAWPGEIER